jgi:hypothetical protein
LLGLTTPVGLATLAASYYHTFCRLDLLRDLSRSCLGPQHCHLGQGFGFFTARGSFDDRKARPGPAKRASDEAIRCTRELISTSVAKSRVPTYKCDMRLLVKADNTWLTPGSNVTLVIALARVEPGFSHELA